MYATGVVEVLAVSKTAPARKVAARQNNYSGEAGRFYSVAGKPFMEGTVIFRQGLVFVLAFGLMGLCIFVQPKSVKSGGIDLAPYGMAVQQISEIIPGNPTQLEVFIRSSIFLDTVTFKIITVEAVLYSGQTEWRQVVNAGDSLTFPLEVIFPPNDTTGFEVTTVRRGTGFTGTGFYAVTTGDSVKTFQVDPRSFPKDTVQPSSEGYLREPHDMPPHDERGDTVKSTTYMPTDRDRMKEKEKTGYPTQNPASGGTDGWDF